MSRPDPLLEIQARLFRAAREEHAPASMRSTVRRAVGVGTGLALTAAAGTAAAGAGGTTQATAGAVTAAVLAKYVAVGVACGALTVGVAEYSRAPSPVPPPMPAQEPSGKALVPAVTTARMLAGARAEDVPAALDSSAPPPMTSERPAAPSSSASPAPSASSAANAVGLADELALLDEARSALLRGDPAAALRALDRYAREVDNAGQMSAEAAVLRIEALVQSGDRDGASATARSFAESNPKSPLLPRVRVLVPELEP